MKPIRLPPGRRTGTTKPSSLKHGPLPLANQKRLGSPDVLRLFWLYARAPTDGIRVWYQSAWAYVGEHGLVWAIAFAALFYFSIGVVKGKVRSDVLTALAATAAEAVSTVYVWFVTLSKARLQGLGIRASSSTISEHVRLHGAYWPFLLWPCICTSTFVAWEVRKLIRARALMPDNRCKIPITLIETGPDSARSTNASGYAWRDKWSSAPETFPLE